MAKYETKSKGKGQALKNIASKGFSGPLSHTAGKYLKYGDFPEGDFDTRETISKSGGKGGSVVVSKNVTSTANLWAQELYSSGASAGTPFHFNGKMYVIATESVPSRVKGQPATIQVTAEQQNV